MDVKRFNKLLKRFKRNPAALEPLYKFYLPKIISYIRNKYNDKQLGEDVAQDFFVKLFKIELPDFVENPTGWIFTLCDNTAKNIITKRGREMLVTNDAILRLAEKSYEQEEYGEYIEKLNKLDTETKNIIIKNVIEGYSLLEIAKSENINYDSVRKKYSRGIKKLKNI